MHSRFSSLSHNSCIAPIATEFITFSLSSELPVNLLQSLGVCAYGQLANCSSDCGNTGKKLFCKETTLLKGSGCAAVVQQSTEICLSDGSSQKYACSSTQMVVLGFAVFFDGVHPLLCFKK